MNVEEFVEFAKKYLENVNLNYEGEAIYSKKETFEEKNGFYLLGLNPGLYPGETKDNYKRDKITDHLERFLHGENTDFEESLGKCKNNAKTLFNEYFKYSLEDVFSTNLIFKTTPDASGLNDYLQLANGYWPIHEAAIKELQPKVFISYGNGICLSAYSYLFIKCNGKLIKEYPTYHKNFKIKVAEIYIEGQSRLLIGFPHFSYFSVSDKNKQTEETVHEIMKVCSEYFM